MRSETRDPTTERTRAPDDDLEEFTAYEDGDSLVVCDRTNPKAWIRSDRTAELRP